MPRLSVAWVRLQRVPPDMRILTPGLRFFSSSSTRRPNSAARMAAISPAAPAPTTATSQTGPTMSPLLRPRRRRDEVFGVEPPAQQPVAEPAVAQVVQRQHRADEAGQEGLALALHQQADDAVHALLHRPDTERRRRRLVPHPAVGPE